MATVNFTVGQYARTRGAGASSIMSADERTSGSYTSSASPSNIQDGSGEVTVTSGEVVRLSSDSSGWIKFGGQTAAVGTGFHCAADIIYEWEIETPGTISFIDG